MSTFHSYPDSVPSHSRINTTYLLHDPSVILLTDITRSGVHSKTIVIKTTPIFTAVLIVTRKLGSYENLNRDFLFAILQYNLNVGDVLLFTTLINYLHRGTH